MKIPGTIILALLVSLLFAFGCGPKTETAVASYYVVPPVDDSLYIEWVVAGSHARILYAKPDLSEFSTPLGNNVIVLTSVADILPGGADAFRPSRHLDSLFIYGFINGQRGLIYSGIDDADWRDEASEDNKYRYALRP